MKNNILVVFATLLFCVALGVVSWNVVYVRCDAARPDEIPLVEVHQKIQREYDQLTKEEEEGRATRESLIRIQAIQSARIICWKIEAIQGIQIEKGCPAETYSKLFADFFEDKMSRQGVLEKANLIQFACKEICMQILETYKKDLAERLKKFESQSVE